MSKVYRDIFSKDRIISEGFYLTEISDGLIYQVRGKRVRNPDSPDDNLFVIDLVNRFELVPAVMSKDEFKAWTKSFGRKLLVYLTEKNPDRVEGFKRSYQDFLKTIISKYDDFEFYTGSSTNRDGSIVMSFYEDESIPAPIFWYFKDALEIVPEEEL